MVISRLVITITNYTHFNSRLKFILFFHIKQIRLGVFDVLPHNALDGLTAEDLRLLLNGTGDINVDVLANYTTFHDETGLSSSTNVDLTKNISESGPVFDKVERLKKWFWNLLRVMDSKQRQDLVS